MIPLPTIKELWAWSEEEIRAWQLQQFNALLAKILPSNKFYYEKIGSERQLKSLADLKELPYTTKSELVASAEQHGLSQHHSFPAKDYSRLHRTSGTTGNPLMILDTEEDWQGWSAIWQHVLEAAEVTAEDRVFLAFSFGPFVGFWSAHQACIDRGALVIPSGGLSSFARLEFLRDCEATVLLGTPTYLLHLAEVAKQQNFDINNLRINRIIVAGESGGSVPTVRKRIEDAWNARVIDHSGATEIGPWGFGWPDRIGLHVIESDFIAELEPIENANKVSGERVLCELILTSLSRTGAPVIRYRTGDAVFAERPTDGLCRFLWLPQGVVGRADDMLTVRGVNIFPSSIDAVLRKFNGIQEYQVRITRKMELDQLELLIEGDEQTQRELESELSIKLGLRIPVEIVEPNCLPRSELKARRWVDQR